MIRFVKGRSQRGFTAFEGLIAFSILSLVLVAGVGVMGSTLQSWAHNQSGLDNENGTEYAMRYVVSRLQEAYSATVSDDGTEVTYVLPAKDGNGDYLTPAVPEGFSRKFYVSNGTLYSDEGDEVRELITGLQEQDPSVPGGSKEYAFFTRGSGQITRSITVHLVTQPCTDECGSVRARHRQSVYLRNVPAISR